MRDRATPRALRSGDESGNVSRQIERLHLVRVRNSRLETAVRERRFKDVGEMRAVAKDVVSRDADVVARR